MIFFDIDETLLKNAAAERYASRQFYFLHQKIIQESLDNFLEYWKELTEQNLRRYFAGELSFQDQRRERLRQVFNDRLSLSDAEADNMFASYLKFYESSWELFPDVVECLNELKAVRLGIISNGDSVQQRQKLDSLGILDRFSTIVISGDIGVSKPDTKIFLTACQKAEASPSECWHIGDDLRADFHGSMASGLNGIWLNRNGQEQPLRIPAIGSLNDLQGYIDHTTIGL